MHIDVTKSSFDSQSQKQAGSVPVAASGVLKKVSVTSLSNSFTSLTLLFGDQLATIMCQKLSL